METDDDDVETEAGGEAREVGVRGEDGGEEITQALGPGLPVVVGVGEGGDEETNEEEEDAHSTADGTARGGGLQLAEGARVEVLEVGHECSKEELHAKEGIVAGPAEHGEAQSNGHAPLLLNVCCGDEEDVDPEGTLEDRHHCPQLGAVFTSAMRPDAQKILHHSAQCHEEILLHIRTRLRQTIPITILRHLERPQLRRKPRQRNNDSHGQDKSRNTPNCRSAHGVESLVLLSLVEVLDGLESANIAGYETEDGDANAALDEDAEVGQLEEDGGGVFGGGWVQEGGEPGGGDVFDYNEC